MIQSRRDHTSKKKVVGNIKCLKLSETRKRTRQLTLKTIRGQIKIDKLFKKLISVEIFPLSLNPVNPLRSRRIKLGMLSH